MSHRQKDCRLGIGMWETMCVLRNTKNVFISFVLEKAPFGLVWWIRFLPNFCSYWHRPSSQCMESKATLLMLTDWVLKIRLSLHHFSKFASILSKHVDPRFDHILNFAFISAKHVYPKFTLFFQKLLVHLDLLWHHQFCFIYIFLI